MSFAFIKRRLPWKRFWRAFPLESPHLLGAAGENAARRFLRRRGYRVLARNYQSPAGEIDLIFRFGPALVFVEVKTRSAFGPKDRRQAAELVQWSRIDHAARYFVARYRIQPCPMRFDLVTVEWTDAARRPCIEHVPGAYTSPLQWA